MWRIAFLVVVLVGALAVTLVLTFGAGAWRISRLQAGAEGANATSTQSGKPAQDASAAQPTAAPANVTANGNPQGPIGPQPVMPPPNRPRLVVDPPGRVLPVPPPAPVGPPAEVPPPLLMYVKDAVIRGDDLRVDAKDTKATVNWQNRFDSLEWSVIVPRTGEYIVEMEYACDPTEGGGVFSLAFSGRTRAMAGIRPTTGWQDYQTVEVARAYLAVGPNDVVLRPTYLQPDHILMNLRSIKITLVREMDEIPEGRPMRGRGFMRRFD